MTTVNLAQTPPPTGTATSDYTRLRPAWVGPARIAWTILSLLCVGAFILLIRFTMVDPDLINQSVTGASLEGNQRWTYWIYPGAMSLGYTTIGIILASRRSTDWLALAIAFMLIGTGNLVIVDTDFLLVGADQRLWIPLTVLEGSIVYCMALMGFLFPDGRLTRRWHKWLLIFLLPAAFGVTYFMIGSNEQYTQWQPIIFGMVLSLLILLVVLQVNRYRRFSSPLQRQQTKWIVIGLGSMLSSVVIWVFVFQLRLFGEPTVPLILVASFVFVPLGLTLPAAFALSMMRYRLWDVDFVINRSLVGVGLTLVLGAVFAGGFFALRAVLEAIFVREMSTVSGIAATGIIVSLFGPSRRILQRFVDRQLYNIDVDYRRPGTPLPSPIAAGGLIPTELASYGELVPIGRGGMAEVYRATHPTLNRPVAIKVLPQTRADDEGYRRRFEREAKIVAGLKHPNIVQVFDYGQANTTQYMVMEFIDGPNLGDAIREMAPIPLDQTADILADVASALDHAHTQGVVHRDVKPSNIMLEPITTSGSAEKAQRAVLMDFGIARIYGGTRLTATGMVGTFDYMAPEQIQGVDDIDGRADVYALGAVAYHMLTGQRVFLQNNPGALLIAHLQQPPPNARDIVPDLSRETAQAIRKAMAKDRDERFTTAGDFAAALAAAR